MRERTRLFLAGKPLLCKGASPLCRARPFLPGDEVLNVPTGVQIRAAIADETGDTLDAILCALQAAWSQRHTDPPNGIPPTADQLEGWIVDSGLLT